LTERADEAKGAPWIVDVRRNALDDGPGIRSVVFFKGCPLRCVWCQNPETLSPRPELQRLPERCTACGACVSACPHNVARPATVDQDCERCRCCGACVEVCGAAARRIAGVRWDLDELTSLLLRDEPFYRHSGGGVTLSGGEPTLFPGFSGALAAALHGREVHVLLQPCGHFGWSAFEQHLLTHLSAVYFDLKLADDGDHRRHAGRGVRRIHDNLRRLAAVDDLDLLPRVPLVPGITDAPANLEALAALMIDVGLGRVALMPYNPLWVPKRRALGLETPYDHDQWMSGDAVSRSAAAFRTAGLAVEGVPA